jgi:hypothetical protein
LLARVMVLVALALALARPMSSAVGAGRGDAVDAVFVVDTSYSMDASDGAASRLERARRAALDVIDQLPARSTVQVISCADRAGLLGPRSPSDLESARKIVQDIQVSHLASDLWPGLNEGAEALARGQSSNKEFYLFSDMHRLGWDQRNKEMLKGAFKRIKDQAAVYLVRCGRSQPKNVAVVDIKPQSGIPRPGERVGFAVLVRNTGAEVVRDLKVSLMVDGNVAGLEPQSLEAIAPGETRAVTLSAKLERPGLRILSARVEPDDMDADNRFDQVIQVRERVKVLVVDGSHNEREPERSASYYLLNALQPVKEADKGGYFLQPERVPSRLASPAKLGGKDLCILANVALEPDPSGKAQSVPPDFVDELARFVRAGHGLLVFAGDNVIPASYNRILGDKHRLLPMKIKGVANFPPPAKPIFVNRKSVGPTSFLKFKDDDNFQSLDHVEVYRTLEFEEPIGARKSGDKDKGQKPTEPEDAVKKKADPAPAPKDKNPAQVVLRYSNGKAAVVTRKADAGEVMFFGTSADPGWKTDSPNPTWTNWPKELMYLPFIDVTVSYLLHGQSQNHNLIAGKTLHWFPRDKEPRAYTLVHPNGKKERLGYPDKEKGLTATDLLRAGIYRLRAGPAKAASSEEKSPAQENKESSQGEGDTFPLAVIPDLHESENLETLGEAELDDRVGFRAVHVTAGDETTTFSEVARLNREWTLWLLGLVLVLLVAESLLAWWCGRGW